MAENQSFMTPEQARFSLDRSRDAVFWILPDGRLYYVNDAACTSLGYTREELLSMNILDIDAVMKPSEWHGHWQQTKEKNSSLIDTFHKRKDGSVFPVQVAINYILYEGEEYHCSMARDMSAQRRHEQILRERDLMLRLLTVAAVAANEAADIQRAMRHVIDEICRMMDWPVGAVYLQSPDSPDYLAPADIVCCSDTEKYAELIKLVRSTGFSKGVAMIGGVFQSGSPRVMQLSEDLDVNQYPLAGAAAKAGFKTSMAFPVKIAADVVGVLVFASNSPCVPDEQFMRVMGDIGTQLGRIIERRRSEVAIQKSQAGLALAQRIAHVGSWEWDLIKGGLVWSDEVYRIFGVSPGIFKPTNAAFLEMLPPDDRASVRRAILKAIEGEAAYEIEHGLIRPDGTKRIVMEKAQVFRDENGRPTKVAGSVQDITDMKDAQREREALMRTLAAKNEELESIIYASSHDLRNPLVNIQGFSWELARDCSQVRRILSEAGLPEDVIAKVEPILKESMPACVEYINSSVRKMDDLLRGLLRLSRLEREPVPASTVDVEILMADMLDSMSYRIEQAQAEVTFGKLPSCRGDAGQIAEIFSNLIDNALKYKVEGRPPKVRISGEVQGQTRVYRVEDNGRGIADMHKDKVFEIFHRLEPEGPITGEGLGLTIVRRIIQRHGGTIRLESEEGKGSVFIITLPGG
ncbi:MAG TPA: PAS domain S-box protein [Sedimentisphaerales bacterium]|nr:PAS domain S-box protein [Sedimentisphaerales bacterium]